MKTFDDIKPGSKVTFIHKVGNVYEQFTGRAVMKSPAGWVVNIGGSHGTPKIVSPTNFRKTT